MISLLLQLIFWTPSMVLPIAVAVATASIVFFFCSCYCWSVATYFFEHTIFHNRPVHVYESYNHRYDICSYSNVPRYWFFYCQDLNYNSAKWLVRVPLIEFVFHNKDNSVVSYHRAVWVWNWNWISDFGFRRTMYWTFPFLCSVQQICRICHD